MKTYEIYETNIGNETFVASIKSLDEQGNTLSIPLDPANSDYAEYLRYTEWVEAGNNPEEFWVQETDV